MMVVIRLMLYRILEKIGTYGEIVDGFGAFIWRVCLRMGMIGAIAY